MPKQKHSREQSSLQLGDFKHFFPTKTHGINEISSGSIHGLSSTHNTSISEQETWHALFKISCKRHKNQQTPHTLEIVTCIHIPTFLEKLLTCKC